LGHIATPVVAIGVAIAAPLAVILGISAGEVARKRRQLLDELGATQAALAEDTAHEFGGRMDALDRDTRILASLVSRTRQAGRPDVETENRIILSAFDALVAVVPHYRTIALYDASGAASVTAIDPTEDRRRSRARSSRSAATWRAKSRSAASPCSADRPLRVTARGSSTFSVRPPVRTK
jgi:maltooligosyltrehalose synthase